MKQLTNEELAALSRAASDRRIMMAADRHEGRCDELDVSSENMLLTSALAKLAAPARRTGW